MRSNRNIAGRGKETSEKQLFNYRSHLPDTDKVALIMMDEGYVVTFCILENLQDGAGGGGIEEGLSLSTHANKGPFLSLTSGISNVKVLPV